VHVQPVLNGLRAALVTQGALAGDDPAVEAAISSLVDALGPALRLAALELAEQAAAEVDAQLTDRSVQVTVSEGDPALRVTDAVETAAEPSREEFDARITLRLPPSLKRLIEDSATIDGDSVNAWVVDALSRRAKRSVDPGRRVTESFDL
jgi:predicted HicB family RNase H-like nuclease